MWGVLDAHDNLFVPHLTADQRISSERDESNMYVTCRADKQV